jgi:aminopeptidase N
MKWYDDLWLKEGFSTYLSYVANDKIKPEWEYFKTITMNEVQKAMPKDCDASSRPISFPVKTKSDIRRVFDPISYSKGALIINMMRGFLGENSFRMGLKNYLKTFEYGNAVQDDLWEVMEVNARKDSVLTETFTVKQIMDSWTVDSAGYPVVTVERNGTDVVISQQRYFLPETNHSDTTKWFIPISYATSKRQPVNEVPEYWLSNTEKSITIEDAVSEDDWIYLNLNRTGYYRVNYDQVSWKNLIKKLGLLPEVTRAQLIDDAFNLARADLTSYDIPITLGIVIRNIAPYEYLSWWAFGNGLEYITNMIKREPAYESYRSVMKFIIKSPYEALGFAELEDETELELLHRARIVELACEFGIDRCTNTAQLLFREWIGNKAENK